MHIIIPPRTMLATVAALAAFAGVACDDGDPAPEAEAVVVERTTTPATGPIPSSSSTSTSDAPDPGAIGSTIPESAPATTGTSGAAASAVVYPVTAQYAGVTWTVTGLDERVDDDETTLLVDLEVTNGNPFGMRWPIDAVRLRDAGGAELPADHQAGTGSRTIELADGSTVATTLEFELDVLPEPAGLSLIIATTDRIPAVVPFVGRSAASGYPVELTFTGATEALPLSYSRSERSGQEFGLDSTLVVEAAGGRVAIDGPGVRAPVGGRLVVLDVVLEAPSTNAGPMTIEEDHYRLDSAGTLHAPIALVESVANGAGFHPRVRPGASEAVTLVFEIPAAATDAALVVQTDEGYASDRIPIEMPPLPPCCGE